MSIVTILKKRPTLFVPFICCLLLQAIFFFGLGYFDNPKQTMIYGTILVLIISIFCISGKKDPFVWNWVTLIPFLLFGLGILFISRYHTVGTGYSVFVLDLLVVFPFYYFIQFNNNRGEEIYIMLAVSATIEGLLGVLYCFQLSFSGAIGEMNGRVMGYTDNPNFLGALGLMMLISGLFLLLKGSDFFIFDVIVAATVGFGVSFMLVSVCRAAILSSVGCFIAFLIFFTKRRKYRENTGLNLIRILALGSIVFIATYAGMQMDNINHDVLEKKAMESAEETPSGAGIETSETLPPQPVSEAEELQNRLDLQGDMNGYTSGRLIIWKIYIDNFSLLGRERGDIDQYFAPGTEWRPHNNIIDYYFRTGYIVGTFYLLFYIAAGVSGLIILFSRKRTSAEDFFLVEAIGCYAFYSLVEVATLPFTRCIPCLFFMLIGPIMIKEKNVRSDVRGNEDEKA